MKIVFIGAVNFSDVTLRKTLELNGNVVGVIAKRIPVYNANYANLALTAMEYKIPYCYYDDHSINEVANWLKGLSPDVIFCFGWPIVLRKEILSIPRLGIIGYHPSVLPKNRGRHPLIWALALGLKKTGSTFFFMDERIDSGDILDQQNVHIDYEDNAYTINEKICRIAEAQIADFLPLLNSNNYIRKSQDNSLASSWRKRYHKDGQLDFRMSKNAIYNLVRALTKPYPGAHLLYKGEEIKIWGVKEIDEITNTDEPGKILAVNRESIRISCYDGIIEIVEHQFKKLPVPGEYIL